MQMLESPSHTPAVQAAIEALVALERQGLVAERHVDGLIQTLAQAIVEHALEAPCPPVTPTA